MSMFFKIFTLLILSVPSILNAEVYNISPSEIKQLMEKNIPLIDVRREDEWKSTGIIDKSHLITFFDKDGKYNFQQFMQEISEIENIEKGLILFCRTGRRTTLIANTINKTGKHKNIYNTKGVTAWSSEKKPLVKYQKN